MQVLTGTPLAANAFRVLGLPAGATQADIESAARRMRIWPNADQIPPTSWDLPWLGPVGRTRNDIEQAFSRLIEPVWRIQQRLLWFASGEIHMAGWNGTSKSSNLASRLAGQSLPTAAHDVALLEFDFLSRQDPQMKQTGPWSHALLRLIQTAGDSGYQEWFTGVEQAGDFEKRVNRNEISAVLGGLAKSIIDDLSFRARDALDRNEFTGFNRAVIILDAVAPRDGPGERCLTDIANRLEDLLISRSNRLCDAIYHGINWERQNWTRYVPANKNVCRQYAGEIEQTIEPLLKSLDLLEAAGGERHRRVALPVSRMFRNLGLGWMRAKEYRKADRIFRRGLKWAGGTPYLEKLKSDRKDVAKRLGLWFRRFFRVGTQTKAATPGKQMRWVAIGVGVFVLRALIPLFDSTRSNNLPPVVLPPSFNQQFDPSIYPHASSSRPVNNPDPDLGIPN